MHWKLARDPYLSPLCKKLGEDVAFTAGFFLDQDPEDAALDDTDWLCTPLPKRAVFGDRPVVLLATGGFFPLHAGHLAMMDHARAAGERAGLSVIGGYLSPGHDDYLRLKCGRAVPPASVRLQRCAMAVAGSSWLSVDPWEALHRRVAVNFTDVTARLQAYLQAHVDPRIEVVYVCGGDNARFALAFSERGRCVVVARPGAEREVEAWRARLAGHPNLLWVAGHHHEASRALRTGAFAEQPRPRLVVRLEDERAVRSLEVPFLREFQAELLHLLAEHAEVRTVALAGAQVPGDVISLDPMLPARHNLAISRLFAPGGYEALGHVARPGASPLVDQLRAIPAGRYALHDDDCVTGATFARVRALLPPGTTISATSVAVEHTHGEDVVDARDFLLGADEGGLVIALPGGRVGRSPYLLPYVDPWARASIAASHAFSIRAWSLNERLFARTALCVRDLPAPARATFQFEPSLPLRALCRWHVERLERAGAPRGPPAPYSQDPALHSTLVTPS